MSESIKPNQLEIKLKDVNSAPEIYLNGEKVDNISDFRFLYGTETDTQRGDCEYELKHYEGEEIITQGLARIN